MTFDQAAQRGVIGMVPHDPPVSRPMDPYKTTLTKPELIDTITNLIDDGIRKSRYGTYAEWQAAVAALLDEHAAK